VYGPERGSARPGRPVREPRSVTCTAVLFTQRVLREAGSNVEEHLRNVAKPSMTHIQAGQNLARMDYPGFHEQGLWSSSGVVEAGCKVAIGTRLKRAGMHWTVRGSNAIMALRCSTAGRRRMRFPTDTTP
jgi:hypothetical protein